MCRLRLRLQIRSPGPERKNTEVVSFLCCPTEGLFYSTIRYTRLAWCVRFINTHKHYIPSPIKQHLLTNALKLFKIHQHSRYISQCLGIYLCGPSNHVGPATVRCRWQPRPVSQSVSRSASQSVYRLSGVVFFCVCAFISSIAGVWSVHRLRRRTRTARSRCSQTGYA